MFEWGDRVLHRTIELEISCYPQVNKKQILEFYFLCVRQILIFFPQKLELLKEILPKRPIFGHSHQKTDPILLRNTQNSGILPNKILIFPKLKEISYYFSTPPATKFVWFIFARCYPKTPKRNHCSSSGTKINYMWPPAIWYVTLVPDELVIFLRFFRVA